MHGVGATLYYDGANLNAVMGSRAPGRHGLRHRPLQPAQVVHAAARRRRPGRRPDRGLGPHRAVPAAARHHARPRRPTARCFDLDYDRPQSIGRLRGFQGNYGVFVRSYAYIRSLGAEGLREACETAVLNANYLLARLRELCGDDLPLAFDERCMHEFVLSGAPLKKELGVRTLDLAKRLLDHGFHPPTVYFPLLVDEALLIEPTETETKETLDAFAEALAAILARGEGGPDDRAERAVLDAGAPARRGGGGEAPGHPPAAVGDCGFGRRWLGPGHYRPAGGGRAVSLLDRIVPGPWARARVGRLSGDGTPAQVGGVSLGLLLCMESGWPRE